MILMALLLPVSAWSKGLLVQLKHSAQRSSFVAQMNRSSVKVNDLGIANWVFVDVNEKSLSRADMSAITNHPEVLNVEKNHTYRMTADFKIHDPLLRNMAKNYFAKLKRDGIGDIIGGIGGAGGGAVTDNPDFPAFTDSGSGSDPEFDKQWGMQDIGVKDAWKNAGLKGNKNVVVAVIDTGVDYTHEDLVGNIWNNPGEVGMDSKGQDKRTNGVDDDGNGFVDDVIGWDFATNDNKPFDMYAQGLEVVFNGGNPGHGTHCSGNVAAAADNGKGISGVAPNVKIMAMRFLTEKGQGDTNGAIGAIKYAVDNGAQILSNSWGSEGDDGDAQTSKALQDAIEYAQSKGVLFVAAAGNGHQGKGYDNDSDPKPGVPASYPQENIISVAAIDVKNDLGPFSNWGLKTVDIAAPGVQVFSTVPGNRYQDKVIDIGFLKAGWDGTSMATPHVAGAAALYLSKHPNATWHEIKAAIMNSATPISAMSGKSTTGGKLNVKDLMK